MEYYIHDYWKGIDCSHIEGAYPRSGPEIDFKTNEPCEVVRWYIKIDNITEWLQKMGGAIQLHSPLKDDKQWWFFIAKLVALDKR